MKSILYIVLFIPILLATSCNSSKSVYLKDSSDKSNSSSFKIEFGNSLEETYIVHIDRAQRIVTLKSNLSLNKGYFFTLSNLNGNINSVIKLYDTSYDSIFIADILEGSPKINDYISPASLDESQEFDKKYTEAIID